MTTAVCWDMARRRVVLGTGVVEGDGFLECTEDGGNKLLRNVISCIAVTRASNPRNQEMLGTDRCTSHQLTVSMSRNVRFSCLQTRGGASTCSEL